MTETQKQAHYYFVEIKPLEMAKILTREHLWLELTVNVKSIRCSQEVQKLAKISYPCKKVLPLDRDRDTDPSPPA